MHRKTEQSKTCMKGSRTVREVAGHSTASLFTGDDLNVAYGKTEIFDICKLNKVMQNI